jgi:hypothetical protein
MNIAVNNLISLLMRIISGEKLEKASTDEVRNRMAILSMLCIFVILTFHFHKYFEFYTDRHDRTNTDLFIYIIIPFAIIAGVSIFLFYYIFGHFSKFVSIMIGILLVIWVTVEIIIRMSDV